MARIASALLLACLAAPAWAQEHEEVPFVSLRNVDFIVLVAFLVFLAILLYYRVPATVAGLLDRRAEGIRTEIAEARALRDEAQALLSSFDARRREMAEQAERIVADARAEATRAAEAAKAEAARAVERRLRAAEEQIASAEARAVARVRDRAVAAAVAAAEEVLARQMSAERASGLIDDSITQVAAKLH